MSFGWWHLTSQITREGQYNGLPNSPATRAEHAKYYKEMRELRKRLFSVNANEKLMIRGKMHQASDRMMAFDKLSHQFLTDREQISVDMGELGIQSTLWVELKPDKVKSDMRPIVLIPGISSNIDGQSTFPIKLAAETGQKVVVIGHPESWFGKVTKEFAEQIQKSDDLSYHGRFFSLAINQILGDETEFDLCGVSAGAIVINELLKDSKINKQAKEVTLIVPPGLADMRKKCNILLGLSMIGRETMFDPGHTASIEKRVCETFEERANQKLTYNGVLSILLKKYDWWNNDRFNSDRITRVVVAKHDEVTLGGIYAKKQLKGKGFSLKIIEGTHAVSLREPERVIQAMFS